MRFAFYSVYGCDLAFVARLQDEGHEVLLFNAGEKVKDRYEAKHLGKDLVPVTRNAAEWRAWGKQTGTVHIFGGSGHGELADDIRRGGGLVIGAGSFADKLEKKRAWAEGLAKSLGIIVPPHKEFADIPSARNYAKGIDGEWVFKTDKFLKASATYLANSAEDMVGYLHGLEKEFGRGGRCLLQRKIPGVAISTAAWWNGKAFLGPFEGTIEHKKFLNDDLGPNTGCSFNVVWMYQSERPEIASALQWTALGSYFAAKGAPPGLYDINALIGDDGNAYFLEFTPRFGYDSEPTAQRLLTIGLGEFYYKLATGQLESVPFSTDHLAYAVRASVPPYPCEAEHSRPMGGPGSSIGVSVLGADGLWDGRFIGYGVMQNKENDQLAVADTSGLVGLGLAVGNDLKGLHKQVMEYLKDELQVPNLQYRTDGYDRIAEDVKKLGHTDFAIKEIKL